MAATVYVLRDPRDNAVRYVGVTVSDLSHRLAQHINQKEGTQRALWIADVVGAGCRPVIEAMASINPARIYKAEREWIAKYRAEGAALLNATNGGKGFSGRHTDETKALISAAKTGKPVVFSDPVGRGMKISAALAGKPKSAEHRARLSAALMGKMTTPPETIQEVLRLRATGLTRQNIAKALGMGKETVGKIVAMHKA